MTDPSRPGLPGPPGGASVPDGPEARPPATLASQRQGSQGGEGGEGGRNSQGLAQAALAIAAVTVVARAVGFARGLVFVHAVGANPLGDAYYAANTVPNVVFEVVAGGALAGAVVPVLAGPVAAGDGVAVRRTASALLTWVVLLLTPVVVVGALLARPMMSLLAGSQPGADRHAALAVGARMLVVFMPQVVLYGVGIVLTGVLQAHRRFLGPALAPLLSSIVVIAAYLLYAVETGAGGSTLTGLSPVREYTLSVGTTLGVLALSLPLAVPLWRAGVRIRPTLSFPPGVARRVSRLAGAGLATLAAQQLSVLVVLHLSYAGPPGTVVLYNLAWTLFLLPWAVLAVPLATTAFPTLVARAEAGDQVGYAALAAGTSRAVVLVSAFAAAVLSAAALPVARVLVLHARGHPDPGALADAVIAFAPGLLGYALVAHLGRALYARGDGRRAAVATVAGWVAVIGADLALVAVLPHSRRLLALGLGNTFGMLVAGAALLAAVGTATRGRGLDGVPRALLTAATTGGLAGAVGWLVGDRLPTGGIAMSALTAVVVTVVVTVVFVPVAAVLDRRDVVAVLLRRRARG